MTSIDCYSYNWLMYQNSKTIIANFLYNTFNNLKKNIIAFKMMKNFFKWNQKWVMLEAYKLFLLFLTLPSIKNVY